ncbi:hypothetical protein WMF31_35790 [Sorangium sp. So ce1036]|uniref:hypothetical protein n=1 Tax=Sorangium sp. So ce1036 TaxID=3133328 RepID=UPI003F06E167
MNQNSFRCLGVALALMLGACGPGQDGDATGGTGGGGASGAAVGSGGQSPTGGAGGAPQETGSASSGGAGGGATPTGGAGSTGGAGPTGSTSGGGDGPGAATGGASGSGGAPGGACTRELLDGLLDDYFAALAAGDPSSLPLAGGVKFTENAVQAEIGTTEFWKNAGEVKHSQRALDTEACSAAAQAVIPEGGRDLPVALRIKVEGSEMTEIETIVVRPGDYTASFAVDSDPAAIIAISDDIGWHNEVPEAERATREELTDWIDKYFRAFPSGVCDVTGACRRLENGGGNFSCSTGASCSAGAPGSGGTFIPRVILADEVRGIAVGFTIFDFMTDGHLDMHMIKMSGGEVHAVHAILRDTNGMSGWE